MKDKVYNIVWVSGLVVIVTIIVALVVDYVFVQHRPTLVQRKAFMPASAAPPAVPALDFAMGQAPVSVIVISAKGKESITFAEPSTFVSMPYVAVDFDGDGVEDHVTMQDNNFSFRKSGKGPWVTLVHVSGECIGFRVGLHKDRMGLFFFDPSGKGYFQPVLGTKDGVPYLGNVEE